MTQAPTTAVVAGRHAARHKRRRRPPTLVLAVAVLLALVLAGVAWNRLAAHWAGDVVVAWSHGPDCTGARVVSDGEEAGGDQRSSGQSLIEARRGMRCLVRIEVRNASAGPVHLEEVTLPLLAGHPGPVVKVDTTSVPGLWPAPPPGGTDVVRPLDVDLSPDERATFDIPLVFNDRGCNAGGTRVALVDFPTVTVRSLLYSFDRHSTTDLAFRQVGPAQGCPASGG